MAEFQWSVEENGRTVVRLAGIEVGDIVLPGEKWGEYLHAHVNLQRWHGGRVGKVQVIRLGTVEEGKRRMQAWLEANRDRLFVEVAEARYPGLEPARAAARLHRELRG